MTTFTAEDISKWEICPRLPALYTDPARILPSIKLPVRDVCKRIFHSSLSQRPFDPELSEAKFLMDAATEGFEYPDWVDTYTVTKDHGSWLAGALHLYQELDLYPIKANRDCPVRIQAFEDSLGGLHTFRVVESFPQLTRLKWPELALCAYYSPHHLTIHSFRLPRISPSGRIQSPLSYGYQHPLTGHYRLARHDNTKPFGPKWLRRGRWEAADDTGITWEEWRVGIDTDRCMNQCVRSEDVQVIADEGQLAGIRADLDAAVKQLSVVWSQLPRKREMCGTCVVREICHSQDNRGMVNGNGAGTADQSMLQV